MALTPSLLAIDLDGTLVRKDGTIHPDDQRAIRDLVSRDIIVTIATGRTPAGTLHVAQSLELAGPCVCTDGAMIVDIGSGDVLRHRPLGPSETQALAIALRRFPNTTSAVLEGNTVILDERAGMLEAVAKAWSPNIERISKLANHTCWTSPDGITAAAIVGLNQEITQIADQLRERTVSVTQFPVVRFPGVSTLLVHAQHVSKGDGLRWLAAHHERTLAETVAVGDWLNDLSMLAIAGESFAMQHAPPRVRATAKHVLPIAREGGAIAAISKLLWPI